MFAGDQLFLLSVQPFMLAPQLQVQSRVFSGMGSSQFRGVEGLLARESGFGSTVGQTAARSRVGLVRQWASVSSLILGNSGVELLLSAWILKGEHSEHPHNR